MHDSHAVVLCKKKNTPSPDVIILRRNGNLTFDYETLNCSYNGFTNFLSMRSFQELHYKRFFFYWDLLLSQDNLMQLSAVDAAYDGSWPL